MCWLRVGWPPTWLQNWGGRTLGFYDGDTRYLDMEEVVKLMGCHWCSFLLLEDRRLHENKDLWAFPPPVSPSGLGAR